MGNLFAILHFNINNFKAFSFIKNIQKILSDFDRIRVESSHLPLKSFIHFYSKDFCSFQADEISCRATETEHAG